MKKIDINKISNEQLTNVILRLISLFNNLNCTRIIKIYCVKKYKLLQNKGVKEMYSKSSLLARFRENADKELINAKSKSKDYKKQADYLNKSITAIKNSEIKKLEKLNISQVEKMDKLLMIMYVYYVIMLEYRNKVWAYDYMAFARRIGEIWEPFCKLPFKFPINNDVDIYEPLSFKKFRDDIINNTYKHINTLNINSTEKQELVKRYNQVWSLVESGGIKLGLDLHVKVGESYYDIDYKSGFSSNEKGNTNRLLLVGSIYHSLTDEHKTLLFVRQKEEDNNHYLQTLKNSPYWEVYCADSTYDKIKELTGFDLKKWINTNIDWKNDISSDFRKHLEDNDLIKYLTW